MTLRALDPTPASTSTDIKYLCNTLIDVKQPLWERYKALFALRNINSDESIRSLAKGHNWFWTYFINWFVKFKSF